jgi:enterobactin synthetase component F
MASLPRTANGKIDRTALRAHVIADGATTRPRREPATPTERRLAAVWADVLELPGVGADDDFFQLGGHSLKGARLAFRVNEETGVLLTLAEVFQHPTVESMARRVDARSADADAHQPRRDAIPLAPLTPDELDLLNE